MRKQLQLPVSPSIVRNGQVEHDGLRPRTDACERNNPRDDGGFNALGNESRLTSKGL